MKHIATLAGQDEDWYCWEGSIGGEPGEATLEFLDNMGLSLADRRPTCHAVGAQERTNTNNNQ